MDEFSTFGGDKIIDFDNPFIAAGIGYKIDDAKKMMGDTTDSEEIWSILNLFVPRTICISKENGEFVFRTISGEEIEWPDVEFDGSYLDGGCNFLYKPGSDSYGTKYCMSSIKYHDSDSENIDVSFTNGTILTLEPDGAHLSVIAETNPPSLTPSVS